MNGKLNENVIVKEYESDKPPIQRTDSRIDKCIRDCMINNFIHLIIFVNKV